MSDQDSLPSNVKNEQSYCHLTNNEDPLKYYPSVLANINADEEKCVTECHAKCEICWSKDNCVPVCQEDKEYKIDGFIQSECARPFYFCNAQLSVNKIVIDNTKVTKKFHGNRLNLPLFKTVNTPCFFKPFMLVVFGSIFNISYFLSFQLGYAPLIRLYLSSYPSQASYY